MLPVSGFYEVIPVSGGSGWSTVPQEDTLWRSGCVWGQTTPRTRGLVVGGEVRREDWVDLSCDVAFEAAHDFAFG